MVWKLRGTSGFALGEKKYEWSDCWKAITVGPGGLGEGLGGLHGNLDVGGHAE
jgi:hypothetical protein